MKHLPQADLILAIDEDGRVAEQGNFMELNETGTYIHSLQIKLEENHGLATDNESSEERLESPKANESTTTANDMSRKTGDWETYKYYSRALGRWPLVVFITLIAGQEVCSGISSKYKFPN